MGGESRLRDSQNFLENSQTIIEPTLDMWTRENKKSNIVVNDPKGELLVKFYVKSTIRGYQPVQFNLINPMKTDIYNPLMLAAESAREGNMTKMASYVENIANVFFPIKGGEEPVWPQAANNAFKRAAYGLIDFYLEEEKEYRDKALREHIPDKILEAHLDELWGHVTLYNCYQLFVQMTSKKYKSPVIECKEKWHEKIEEWKEKCAPNPIASAMANDPEYQAYAAEMAEAKSKEFLWDDKQSVDLLTLFFNASKALPRNAMRTQVQSTDDALRAMGGAEKMLASVYGIAITAMSFFSDPTISTLTSGKRSQNVDLGGMSFPRRIGIQFHPEFLSMNHFPSAQVRWSAFEDINFTKPLGEKFDHTDLISSTGWAMYFIDGIFPTDKVYLKLQIFNSKTDILIDEYFFMFQKSYQTTLDARSYVTDPILEEKIVKDGTLTELQEVELSKEQKEASHYESKEKHPKVYEPGKRTFVQKRLKVDENGKPSEPENEPVSVIMQMTVRYSEKPKIIFMVTPPHLAKYTKLLLILLKQLVDLNFDQSYLTKPDQKPCSLYLIQTLTGYPV